MAEQDVFIKLPDGSETSIILERKKAKADEQKSRLEAYARYAALLKAYNLNSHGVSKATGIATSSLADWKSGRSMPKAEKLQLISEYLGVSIDYLVTGNTVDANADKALPPDVRIIAGKMAENHDLYSTILAIQNLTPRQMELVRSLAFEFQSK